jgi:hypothetical protein
MMVYADQYLKPLKYQMFCQCDVCLKKWTWLRETRLKPLFQGPQKVDLIVRA